MVKEERADYVQDLQLRNRMDRPTRSEKTGGRAERRTSYTTQAIDWLYGREDGEQWACSEAVNMRCTSKQGTSDQWHYYLCSRGLTAEELLRYARLAWTGERMHELLEVHFGEDCCRIEDRNGEQNLTIIRKIVRNMIKGYTTQTASQRPISNVMFDCLLESENIRSVLKINKN
jgi:predicted transposase YbfD/YdcC